MKIMAKQSEKIRFMNWGNFFQYNCPHWKESDARAYISAFLSRCSPKKALNAFACKEYVKWGFFYMENAPTYDSNKDFFAFDVLLSLFDEKTLSEIAMGVPPPVQPPVIPPF
uniref:Uncharacterized protein n=1 Tax=Promethearchaeum syntrophicum TaxID=2594042 RepID=A0A5B9DF68_9ARCH|nr:hypothetical protein [Candidatus Prometheoarchaeum syntrophicum]QEE17752.1 hypothetical protein DSAG12_03590 [Candidatus Prometheoarchaeum syntrophicum]